MAKPAIRPGSAYARPVPMTAARREEVFGKVVSLPVEYRRPPSHAKLLFQAFLGGLLVVLAFFVIGAVFGVIS